MDNHQATAEWIAQQRAVCDAATGVRWTWYGDELVTADGNQSILSINVDGDRRITINSKNCDKVFISTARTALPAALDALEASMQREAEKDAIIARLTAERDAEKKRADAVTEINLRPLQPGYMGVCTTDDEDGIQIREVSHKHPQGRGYLDDDENVQDVVVIRFADTAQVLAVVDRLLVLADAMAGKVHPCAENAPEGGNGDG